MKRSAPLGRSEHTWPDGVDPPVSYPVRCEVCDFRLPADTEPMPLCPGPEDERSGLERGGPLERTSRISPVSGRRAEKRPDLGTELETYVEGLTCLLADHPEHTCRGDVVAHHVRHKNHAGDWTRRGGERVGNLVPLCSIGGHQGGPESVHVMGRGSFEERWDLDLAVEAARIGSAFLAEGVGAGR